MQRIIKESKIYDDEEEGENDDDEDVEMEESGEQESVEEESEEEEKFGESSDDEGEAAGKKGTSGKKSLKARVREEQEIRLKEKNMRTGTDKPTSIDDFERLVVANTDQSYVWI